jgi:hypothetical protein
MSYSNPDELTNSEIDHIQYLYYQLYETYLPLSIGYIIELGNQDSIVETFNEIENNNNQLKPLIQKYFYKKYTITSRDDFYKKYKITLSNLQEINNLIKDNVFTYFYEIIKPIPHERHLEKIYKKIIISDLYKFIPLIIKLIEFYSNISQIVYQISNEFIYNITFDNIKKTTNNMIFNALFNNYCLLKLLNELLNFIKTRKINKIDEIKTNEIRTVIAYSTKLKVDTKSKFDYYIDFLKTILVIFYNINTYPNDDNLLINFKNYLERYIKSDKNVIKVQISDTNLLYKNFIKHIKDLLLNYLRNLRTTTFIKYSNLHELFYIITNIKNAGNTTNINELIILLTKIINSINIINAKMYNYIDTDTDINQYNYIFNGINIIILLNKLIEYLHNNEFIITYDINVQVNNGSFSKATFLKYIQDEIYPSITFGKTGTSDKTEISTIMNDIETFLNSRQIKQTSLKSSKSLSRESSSVSSVSSKPISLKSLVSQEINPNIVVYSNDKKSVLTFIEMLKKYVLIFFYNVVSYVNDNKLNTLKKLFYNDKILYDNNTFTQTLLYNNIKKLFENIDYKISNNNEINDSINYLLKYIIDLITNICIILINLGKYNKLIINGIVNIDLLNKLIKLLKKSTITYSNYDYNLIEDTETKDTETKNKVMTFIISNNIEYDLNEDIFKLYSESINETSIYDKIEITILAINLQYTYTIEHITVVSGGNLNKYKKTENKITVIYKKKQYTRIIYICERKKYVKINKTYMLLSKLKKI